MTSYRDYYRSCRRAYPASSSASIYDLGVHSQVPGRPERGDLLDLGADYLEAVRSVGEDVARRIESWSEIFAGTDATLRDLAIQVDDPWSLAGLEELAEILIPQVEERVLGCYAAVNQVGIIRTVPCATPPTSSWLWHYDNCADEAFKVLIYLTEVGAESGAFEYLRHGARGDCVRVPSSRVSADDVRPPRWPGSRVPEAVIEDHLSRSFESVRVEGPAGTTLVFHNNCIHRATVPTHRYRDAAILALRPAQAPVVPRIARLHTGSWSYNAKQWIPEVLDVGAAAEGVIG